MKSGRVCRRGGERERLVTQMPVSACAPPVGGVESVASRCIVSQTETWAQTGSHCRGILRWRQTPSVSPSFLWSSVRLSFIPFLSLSHFMPYYSAYFFLHKHLSIWKHKQTVLLHKRYTSSICLQHFTKTTFSDLISLLSKYKNQYHVEAPLFIL